MAKKKKEDSVNDKDALARQRVEVLLSDVPKLGATKTETVDVLEDVSKEKGTAWLENQIEALTEENERLIQENAQVKDDFRRLSTDFIEFRKSVGAGLPVDESKLKTSIVSLFRKLENQYLGKNPEQVRYTDIKFVVPNSNTGLLDEFIKHFGDILKG